MPVVTAVTPDHLSPSLNTKLSAVFSCLFHFLILSPFHSSPSLLPLPLVPLSSSPSPSPISFSLLSRHPILPSSYPYTPSSGPQALYLRFSQPYQPRSLLLDSTCQECCSQRWPLYLFCDSHLESTLSPCLIHRLYSSLIPIIESLPDESVSFHLRPINTPTKVSTFGLFYTSLSEHL